MRKMLGTIITGPLGLQSPEVNSNAALPKNFDSRVTFKDCVHSIRNQERCGSCWAFGASEALSDRFCVASKGAVNVVLSP
jgi:cathepsin B